MKKTVPLEQSVLPNGSTSTLVLLPNNPRLNGLMDNVICECFSRNRPQVFDGEVVHQPCDRSFSGGCGQSVLQTVSYGDCVSLLVQYQHTNKNLYVCASYHVFTTRDSGQIASFFLIKKTFEQGNGLLAAPRIFGGCPSGTSDLEPTQMFYLSVVSHDQPDVAHHPGSLSSSSRTKTRDLLQAMESALSRRPHFCSL